MIYSQVGYCRQCPNVSCIGSKWITQYVVWINNCNGWYALPTIFLHFEILFLFFSSDHCGKSVTFIGVVVTYKLHIRKCLQECIDLKKMFQSCLSCHNVTLKDCGSSVWQWCWSLFPVAASYLNCNFMVITALKYQHFLMILWNAFIQYMLNKLQ